MKSIQETFDIVYKHLTTQKRKSLLPPEYRDGEDGNACAYRGKNGLKCAVGVLIDDAFYQTSLENKAAGNPVVLKALEYSGINVDNRYILSLLSQCQEIHDNSSAKTWKTSLKRLAERFKLKVKGVK